MKKGNLKNCLAIFIAVFAFVLYAQSISFDYTVDDTLVITGNNLVKKGISAIPTLLKTDKGLGFNNENLRVRQYRPLPLVVYALEWQFFPDSPHFYHLINVLLYSLSCWLLFVLLCRLPNPSKGGAGPTRNSPLWGEGGLIFPFICSLLFAAHPIHTEVVDSIKSLDEILCFIFAFLSIFLFIKVIEKKSMIHFSLALLCYFLSILSKETGISFLIIIPLMLYVFTTAEFKKILFITLFLAVTAGAFLFIRLWVLKSIPESSVANIISPYQNSLVTAPDLLSEKATAFYILLRYIFLLVFPYHLAFDYSIAEIPVQQISSPVALLGIICYLVIGIYAILKIKRKGYMAFAILLYLITLAPVSNIFLLIYCTMAERFLFTPSLGFCMMLAFLLIKLTQDRRWIHSSVIGLPSPVFFALIIASLYSIRTIARNPDWKDNATLYSHDVNMVPNSARAHYNYGLELLYTFSARAKDKEERNEMLHSSVIEFSKAESLFANTPYVHSYLGAAYLELGDYANAIRNYETEIQLSYPMTPPASVFCDLGTIYTKTAEFSKAISILDSSLKYYPLYTDAYVKKSYAYLSEGKNMEAIAVCDDLLKLDAGNIFAYINKGCGYMNLKQFANAIEYFNKALSLDSTNVDCLHLLAMTYNYMGDSITAVKFFQKETMIRGK